MWTNFVGFTFYPYISVAYPDTRWGPSIWEVFQCQPQEHVHRGGPGENPHDEEGHTMYMHAVVSHYFWKCCVSGVETCGSDRVSKRGKAAE